MTTKNQYEMRTPCESCPYRHDAPLAMWSKKEFDNLKAQDAMPFGLGSTFGCHGEIKKAPRERGICIGWLLDQKNHNVPSIRLCVQLNQSPELLTQFKEARPPRGVKLYKSIDEMCEANYPGNKDRPRPKECLRVVNGLTRCPAKWSEGRKCTSCRKGKRR